MSKFLLILVLFNPETNAYQEKVGMFDTLKQCKEARVQVLPTIKQYSKQGSQFVLVCSKGAFVNSVQS